MEARLIPMLLLSCLMIASITTTTATAASSGGHPGRRPWRYDVFLSFRGPDVRHSFIAHLYRALERKGIRVFIDDIDLPRGQTIAEAIPRAIEEARFSVIVLSKGYASSRWCLDELANIVHECGGGSSTSSEERGDNGGGHQTFPVFHHLSRSEVSDLSSGCYKSDFDNHEKRFTYHRVDGWRRAVTSIAGTAGWVLDDHRSEDQLVEDIATHLLWKIQELGGRDDLHGTREEQLRNQGSRRYIEDAGDAVVLLLVMAITAWVYMRRLRIYQL